MLISQTFLLARENNVTKLIFKFLGSDLYAGKYYTGKQTALFNWLESQWLEVWLSYGKYI